MSKKLYIIKFGGSIITDKKSRNLRVQRKRLEKIAKNIQFALKKRSDLQLIIIHGAGGPGHSLAKKYALHSGTRKNRKKLHGALLSRLTNQKLNTEIFNTFVSHNIPVIPTHTGSIIIQDNRKIKDFNIQIISSALDNNYIPLIYGDMTFDKTLGLSVCSGDASAAYLAKYLKAKKVLFATDTDGVFDRDPHVYKDAHLIPKISLTDIFSQKKVRLTRSHNTDVTNGLKGKLHSFEKFTKDPHDLESITIFNGKNPDNIKKILLDQSAPSTLIATSNKKR